MHVDWWSVGVGFYAALHFCCTVTALIIAQKARSEANDLRAQLDAGLHYANTHTNNSIAALRNGSGVHGN